MHRKILRRVGWTVVVLALASLASLYTYGRFAERARGAEVHALPLAEAQTGIDQVLAPLVAAHGGRAGVMVLPDNAEAFAVRAMTARRAGRSLDLQYYIWHPDFTGNLLFNELLRAADRGVRVRLLLDDMNVHGSKSVLAALDSHPLIEVRMFNPTRAREGSVMRGVELLLRFFSVNRRMHNKAWIADGRVAVVGGRNIGDEYFDAAEDVNFMDTDALVVGPPVAQAERVFDGYWNSATAIPLAALVQAPADALARLRHSIDAGLASVRATPYVQHLRQAPGVQEVVQGRRPLHWARDVAIVADPPAKAEGAAPGPDWMTPQLAARMQRAQRQLRVISPYFVPGEAGLRFVQALRARGVEVGVLTNSLAANDVVAVHGGYAGYRVPLLRQGVALYELKPQGRPDGSLFGSSGASLHTKAFLVDDSGGFIGSFNLDPRSMNLNTEMGLVFDDPGIAAELARIYRAKTAAAISYRLELGEAGLRWHDEAAQPPVVWTHEPEASLGRRAAARVIGWLPVESQL